MHDADPVELLQRWYAAHCDGSWEHQNGIRIETLDNPGWSVTIDLADTELQKVPFTPVEHEAQSSWWRCWRDDRSFHATCSSTALKMVLAAFNEWANHHSLSRHP